jgi:hypothetical protein
MRSDHSIIISQMVPRLRNPVCAHSRATGRKMVSATGGGGLQDEKLKGGGCEGGRHGLVTPFWAI